jgi:hypothetical protein
VKASGSDYDTTWATPSDDIPKSIIDAKGDLIVGTAADTASRLAVGTANGQVLTVDSTTTEGVKWVDSPFPNYLSQFVLSGTQYQGVPGVATSGSTSVGIGAGGANRTRYSPIEVTRQITVTRASVNIAIANGTAGTVARLGVYKANSTWGPDDLVADWGTVAIDSTGQKTILSLTTVLVPGRYLLAVGVPASGATFRGVQGGLSTQQFLDPLHSSNAFVDSILATLGSSGSGALPDPGTAIGAVVLASTPMVYPIYLYWTV